MSTDHTCISYAAGSNLSSTTGERVSFPKTSSCCQDHGGPISSCQGHIGPTWTCSRIVSTSLITSSCNIEVVVFDTFDQFFARHLFEITCLQHWRCHLWYIRSVPCKTSLWDHVFATLTLSLLIHSISSLQDISLRSRVCNTDVVTFDSFDQFFARHLFEITCLQHWRCHLWYIRSVFCKTSLWDHVFATLTLSLLIHSISSLQDISLRSRVCNTDVVTFDTFDQFFARHPFEITCLQHWRCHLWYIRSVLCKTSLWDHVFATLTLSPLIHSISSLQDISLRSRVCNTDVVTFDTFDQFFARLLFEITCLQHWRCHLWYIRSVLCKTSLWDHVFATLTLSPLIHSISSSQDIFLRSHVCNSDVVTFDTFDQFFARQLFEINCLQHWRCHLWYIRPVLRKTSLWDHVFATLTLSPLIHSTSSLQDNSLRSRVCNTDVVTFDTFDQFFARLLFEITCLQHWRCHLWYIRSVLCKTSLWDHVLATLTLSPLIHSTSSSQDFSWRSRVYNTDVVTFDTFDQFFARHLFEITCLQHWRCHLWYIRSVLCKTSLWDHVFATLTLSPLIHSISSLQDISLRSRVCNTDVVTFDTFDQFFARHLFEITCLQHWRCHLWYIRSVLCKTSLWDHVFATLTLSPLIHSASSSQDISLRSRVCNTDVVTFDTFDQFFARHLFEITCLQHWRCHLWYIRSVLCKTSLWDHVFATLTLSPLIHSTSSLRDFSLRSRVCNTDVVTFDTFDQFFARLLFEITCLQLWRCHLWYIRPVLCKTSLWDHVFATLTLSPLIHSTSSLQDNSLRSRVCNTDVVTFDTFDQFFARQLFEITCLQHWRCHLWYIRPVLCKTTLWDHVFATLTLSPLIHSTSSTQDISFRSPRLQHWCRHRWCGKSVLRRTPLWYHLSRV